MEGTAYLFMIVNASAHATRDKCVEKEKSKLPKLTNLSWSRPWLLIS